MTSEFKVRREGKGRETQNWPDYADDWAYAKEMGGVTDNGEWVPTSAIKLDNRLSPREGGVDMETVDRYRENWRDLPPVTVQKDTFVLIDGWHRFHAIFGESGAIRVIEVDIPDSDLFIHAYLTNVAHGRPLSTKERVAAARRIWEQYVAAGEIPSPTAFARQFGVSASLVEKWEHERKRKAGLLDDAAGDRKIRSGDITHSRSEPAGELKEKAPRQPGTAKAPTERRIPDKDATPFYDEAKPLSETVLDPLSREMARGLEAAEQQEAALPKPEPFYETEQERIDREMAEAVERARTPEPELVRNSWDQIERVLAGIEEMAGMLDAIPPREFLTDAEPYQAMQQMDVTHFERAAAWLSATARALRTGRDD